VDLRVQAYFARSFWTTCGGRFMFKALLAMIVIFFVATFPATWLLMLFLGNVHVNVSYWGALPLGVIVSVLIGAAASQSDY